MRTARKILFWLSFLSAVCGLFLAFSRFQQRRLNPQPVSAAPSRVQSGTQIWGNRDPVPDGIRADGHLMPESTEDNESSDVVFGGAPKPGGLFPDPCPLQVLNNTVYVVGYCPPDGGPHWSAYHLTRVNQLINVPREPEFHPDSRVRDPVETAMYTRSGYDRGHMTPHFAIATRFPEYSPKTFLLTNVLPQRPQLNRGLWEQLEVLIAAHYAQDGEVWVINGPIYGTHPSKLAKRISIPTHFYHIVFRVNSTNQVSCLAFIFPQEIHAGTRLQDFLVPLQEIEDRTGLQFAPELNARVRAWLVSNRPDRIWSVN